LLFGLELLVAVGARQIEAFGDSLLVVQQVSKVFQCFDESLNVNLDTCLDIIVTLDYFSIAHISRHENCRANELTQQASSYHVHHDMFYISQEPMSCVANISKAEPQPTDSATNFKACAGHDKDWRKPIVDYLQDPSKRVDKTVRRMVFKYILIDNDLYSQTVDGILLKCLDEDQARVAMGEVHEGICGTH